MNQQDVDELRGASFLLEEPRWIARLTDVIGMPIEWAIARLPKRAGSLVSKATVAALSKTLDVAVSTLDHRARRSSSRGLHKTAVAFSGGVGGFFGVPGLVFELPISTGLILRSIADIARSEGENIADIETRLACMQVFALGGRRKSDDLSETAYYAVRIGLARTLSEVAEYVAQRGLVDEGAPAIVRFIASLAARFDVVVTEKLAAQFVPVVGALGGATVNLLFMDHFQAVARGHFIVRRLERRYGEATVRREYERVVRQS